MAEGFKIASAYVEVTAKNMLADGISSALGMLGKLKGAEGEAGDAATGMGSKGKLAILGIAGAAVGGAVELVKMAGNFQSSTERLVTSAGESEKNIKMVRAGILDMAGAVGYSSEELSTAMYKVESGGRHGADGLTVLKAAAEGAKTENADLTVVADAVTSAMTDYHSKASDAAEITSKLVAATGAGKMTFQELAGSMSAILPVASANHVSLNDILGDLASMTTHGMSAQQASQNLADTIRHMAAPTMVQQKEFALLGLTSQDVSNGLGKRGLSGTLDMISEAIKKNMGPESQGVILNLQTAFSKLDPAVKALGQQLLDGTITQKNYSKAAQGMTPELAGQAQQFATLAKSTHGIGTEQKSASSVMQSYSGALRQATGDATGMNVALMLTGDNLGTTKKAIDTVSGATTEAGGHVKGWHDIQSTFNQKIAEAKDSLGALGIKIGTVFLPVATKIAGVFADATKFMTEHKAVAETLAGILGGVVVVGLAAVTLAVWSFTIALLANPMVWVVAGIMVLIGAIVLMATHWSFVTRILGDVWTFIKRMWNDVWTFLVRIFDDIKTFVERIWNDIWGFFGRILTDIKNFFVRIFDDIKNWISDRIDDIKRIFDWFGQLPGKVAGWFGDVKNKAVEKLGDLVGWIAGLPGRITGALGDLGGLLVNAGKSLIEGFGRGIEQAAGWVKDKAKGLLGDLRGLFPFSPAKEGPFSGTGYTSFSGQKLMTDFGKGISGGAGAVHSAVTGVMQSAQSVLSGGSVPSLGSGGAGPAFAGAPGATGGAGGVQIGTLTLQVSGNLDPTNPVAWKQAMKNIRDGINGVERSYR